MRRRVDDADGDAIAPRGFYYLDQFSGSALDQRRRLAFPKPPPPSQAALNISVAKYDSLPIAGGDDAEVRRQRAFPDAAFSGRNGDDPHDGSISAHQANLRLSSQYRLLGSQLACWRACYHARRVWPCHDSAVAGFIRQL